MESSGAPGLGNALDTDTNGNRLTRTGRESFVELRAPVSPFQRCENLDDSRSGCQLWHPEILCVYA